MKFLIEFTAGGPESVRGAWAKVLQHLGHQVQFWNPQAQSAHDAFARFSPHVFIGTTYGVDDAVEKCIRARPGLKVALFGSAWGPMADALPADEFPIVRVSEDEKRRLSKLKEETDQPLFVFIHARGQYLEGSMSGWRSIGIEPLGVLNAADVYSYGPWSGHFRPNLTCAGGMVGGYWGYKSKKLNPYIFPLISAGLDVKIFGRSPWPTPAYLGSISQQNEANLFKSATVCLNVSEPHSTDSRYGADIIERVFKVQSCGGFLLSDYVPEMDLAFEKGCFVTADSPQDFHDKVRHFVKNPDERRAYQEKGQAYVLARHTYHHRVKQLLEGLGFEDEGEKCLSLLEGILKGTM